MKPQHANNKSPRCSGCLRVRSFNEAVRRRTKRIIFNETEPLQLAVGLVIRGICGGSIEGERKFTDYLHGPIEGVRVFTRLQASLKQLHITCWRDG